MREESKSELRARRERLRRDKERVECLLDDLAEQLDGYHALNRRLAVELARVERQIRVGTVYPFVTDARTHIGEACLPCVGHLGSRNPERFATPEELRALETA